MLSAYMAIGATTVGATVAAQAARYGPIAAVRCLNMARRTYASGRGHSAAQPGQTAQQSVKSAATENAAAPVTPGAVAPPPPAAPGGKVTDSVDPNNVIPTLTRIERLLGKRTYKFPRIVVVGNQSSGKSSVLESLVGEDFLPKGTTMVTCRPIELNLVRTTSGKWAELANGRRFYDLKQLEEYILEENRDIQLSEEPLQITIHSPEVHNLNLVDLPGYIHAIKKGQSEDLPDRIQKLCQPYIEDKNNVIVAVASAAEDVAMSMGVLKAQQVDREGTRSMGVVTKMDLVKSRKHIVRTLKNLDYPLGLGYIGVRCRTQTELERGVKFDQVIKIEEEYIKKAQLREPGVRVGIPTLRKTLSEELLHKISSVFPEIIRELDKRIEVASSDEKFLLAISKMSDLRGVASELEKLVKQFNPSAPSRLEFERDTREAIRRIVSEAWVTSVERNFDFGRMSELSQESVANFRPGAGDAKLRKQSLNMLRGLNNFDPLEKFEKGMDMFNRLLIFGDGTPEKFDDRKLADLSEDVLTTGLLAPFYAQVFPETYLKARLEWQDRLAETVDDVVQDEMRNIVNLCRDKVVNDLLAFVENVGKSYSGAKKVDSDMARFYFQFLIKKISSQIDDIGLSKTLTGMLLREKRAVADFFDFQHACQEILKTPKIANSWSFFGNGEENKWPIVVPMYGEVYTKAYFSIVVRRTTNDIFRVLAVQLLNPLIFEAIHYSLNLFKSGKIQREAKAQIKVLEELQGYRDVLVKAHSHYKASPDRDIIAEDDEK